MTFDDFKARNKFFTEVVKETAAQVGLIITTTDDKSAELKPEYSTSEGGWVGSATYWFSLEAPPDNPLPVEPVPEF